MTDTVLPHTVRGKRPQFHTTPGVDEAISMILVLAQELLVLRERMDSAERVAALRGVPLADEIENLEPGPELVAEREMQRQQFFDRLFQVFAQKRSELEANFTADKYDAVIRDIARGD